MLKAALWGGIAGSSVFIGALIGLYFHIKKHIIGMIMAFGTGVLFGAASFELLNEAIKDGNIKITAIGFVFGAFLFTLLDLIIVHKGGHHRKRSSEKSKAPSGLAIFIGTLMDAIPESMIIGISMIGQENVSWLLVVAIFISNLPEGLSSSIGLKKDGYKNNKILSLWLMVSILSLLSSLCGFVFLQNTSSNFIAIIRSFAAGGIVSMVSSTMMPEAYEEGGPIVGLMAALGLLSSLILTHIK
ncbi:ZIP family metal transporter [Crassaminicella profunda]|uniref:ZIP family metal transporter n=1 Tax=Crassaminicella profunda TaxID=1286698 RepID=UPI001CA74BE4|nr:ZIP family metal transporter [Crassaminicella profunda]QZY54903.1 ZIP family metal transporter [Crassaminicella profunda]